MRKFTPIERIRIALAELIGGNLSKRIYFEDGYFQALKDHETRISLYTEIMCDKSYEAMHGPEPAKHKIHPDKAHMVERKVSDKKIKVQIQSESIHE